MRIFPFFKKNKLKYDETMNVKNRSYQDLMESLDSVPDELKHVATSQSYDIYVETLQNISMSRYSWHSPFISEHMLDNIEKFLLAYKQCAILREKKIVNGVTIYSDWYGVYKFTVTRFSRDGELPLIINIQDKCYNTSVSQYDLNEFIIIKDFSSYKRLNLHGQSISDIIANYANKLSLIDNVIEMNLYKHKLPLHVTGKMEVRNTARAYFKELYRNALYMFDGGGIDNNIEIHSPEVEYIIDQLQKHKESLMQEFCTMIGVNNNQNFSDVYQNIEQVKINSSFVYNVAQMHFINRKKVINRKLADIIQLTFDQNEDIYGKVDLIKPDESES